MWPRAWQRLRRVLARPLPPPAPRRTLRLPTEDDVRCGADLPSRLRCLHDDYVEQVNSAVAEGREDLVPGLVDAYMDEALEAITLPTRAR